MTSIDSSSGDFAVRHIGLDPESRDKMLVELGHASLDDLVDYGFHAPTMSFPVAGTLMVEPTESEDLAELDRFVDAMIASRVEIEEVADGAWPVEESPLRRAPHTAATLVGDWDRPHTREQAYGDRNLVCSCPSPDAFEN
jgi:glycine dehydrogenase